MIAMIPTTTLMPDGATPAAFPTTDAGETAGAGAAFAVTLGDPALPGAAPGPTLAVAAPLTAAWVMAGGQELTLPATITLTPLSDTVAIAAEPDAATGPSLVPPDVAVQLPETIGQWVATAPATPFVAVEEETTDPVPVEFGLAPVPDMPLPAAQPLGTDLVPPDRPVDLAETAPPPMPVAAPSNMTTNPQPPRTKGQQPAPVLVAAAAVAPATPVTAQSLPTAHSPGMSLPDQAGPAQTRSIKPGHRPDEKPVPAKEGVSAPVARSRRPDLTVTAQAAPGGARPGEPAVAILPNRDAAQETAVTLPKDMPPGSPGPAPVTVGPQPAIRTRPQAVLPTVPRAAAPQSKPPVDLSELPAPLTNGVQTVTAHPATRPLPEQAPVPAPNELRRHPADSRMGQAARFMMVPRQAKGAAEGRPAAQPASPGPALTTDQTIEIGQARPVATAVAGVTARAPTIGTIVVPDSRPGMGKPETVKPVMGTPVKATPDRGQPVLGKPDPRPALWQGGWPAPPMQQPARETANPAKGPVAVPAPPTVATVAAPRAAPVTTLPPKSAKPVTGLDFTAPSPIPPDPSPVAGPVQTTTPSDGESPPPVPAEPAIRPVPQTAARFVRPAWAGMVPRNTRDSDTAAAPPAPLAPKSAPAAPAQPTGTSIPQWPEPVPQARPVRDASPADAKPRNRAEHSHADIAPPGATPSGPIDAPRLPEPLTRAMPNQSVPNQSVPDQVPSAHHPAPGPAPDPAQPGPAFTTPPPAAPSPGAVFAPPPQTPTPESFEPGSAPVSVLSGPAPTHPTNQAPEVDLPKGVTEQLARAVQDDRIELLLDPVELGRVRFELTTTGDRVQVNLSVERPETLDLLRRNAEALRTEFRDAGFDASSLSFSDWGKGHEQGQAATPDQPHLAGDGPDMGGDLPAPKPIETNTGSGLNLRL